MADLASVAAVGERIVDLLRQRQRADLAARVMAPLTAAFDIVQRPSGEPPAAEGLSVACVQIAVDLERRNAPHPAGDIGVGPPLGLALSFLIVARAAGPAHEQAMLAWAMLVLASYPVLKEAPGDPPIALILQATDGPELGRLCAGLGSPLRLAFVVATRELTLEPPPRPEAAPPVRLGRPG